MKKLQKNSTISLFTLGCKVNLYETRQIIRSLVTEGYYAVEGLTKADYYIINTCAVTNEAERKSRQAISRCLSLNPDAKILVCGCASEKNFKQFENENVVFIKGNADKTQLINQFLKDEEGIEQLPQVYYGGEIFASDNTSTRAIIKVQDGCNNFCSYCIIPYLRGRSRSRNKADIIKEVETLSKFKEIVFTGIDLSDYDKKNGGLAELIKSLAFSSSRKRLGSLEVNVIDQNLMDAMKESGFCPHFHLSLQSGSDKVLKDMNRHYNRDAYLKAVELIRNNFDNAGITTDIIVGFPTEREEDFIDTCNFAKLVSFNDIHVFPFSARSGTVASRLKALPPQTIKSRAGVLNKIKGELIKLAAQRQIGSFAEVLTEENKGKYIFGYTKNYTKAYLNADNIEKNKIYKIIVAKQLDDGVIGDIIE